MTNLNFEVGTYEEYCLNGGETIRVNVSDPGIIDRLKGCLTKVDELREKYGDDLTDDNISVLDKEIRAMIDGVINCPGACDKAFGATNCFAFAGGQPIFVNFLEALLAQLKKDIVAVNIAEKSAFEKLNNERTQKYITQSKPQAVQLEQTNQAFNIAALSQAERERLLTELMGEPK